MTDKQKVALLKEFVETSLKLWWIANPNARRKAFDVLEEVSGLREKPRE